MTKPYILNAKLILTLTLTLTLSLTAVAFWNGSSSECWGPWLYQPVSET